MSDERKKPEVLHIKKFDGGRRTPAEMHREVAIAHKCSTCGDPAALRAKFLAPEDEFKRREPDAYAMLVRAIGADPAFKTTYGPMIHVESVYACDRCKTGLKRFAARKPDWVLVEFDEQGLESSHPTVVQVPGAR